MKHKLICLLTVALMLTVAIAANQVDAPSNRVHQHLQAQEKSPCTHHDEQVFCTHLPLISITTDAPMPPPYQCDEHGTLLRGPSGERLENSETVAATVSVFDHELQNNHLCDEPELSERALIRIRGRSSRSFDKSNYLLKFKQPDMTENKNVSLCGMAAESNWALHGPFLDKTLLRNYLCYNLAGEIMDYAPNVRFCEVFLNGEYIGVYLIEEKVDYSKNGRVNITKSDPDLETTSYILKCDKEHADPLYNLNTFGSYSMNTGLNLTGSGQLSIVYPSATLTQAQHDYIEADFSEFEHTLFSFDYKDPSLGYRGHINVDSFVDFFILTEFTMNYDSPYLSTYLYKDIGGKINLCVWDFNSAFDYYAYSTTQPQSFSSHQSLWFRYLMKDQYFVDQVVARYTALRGTYLQQEYLLDYIDDVVDYLGPAIERNFDVWGYSFQSSYNGENYDYLIPEQRNVRSYDQAIAQLKECIIARGEYMDHNISTLYQLCHTSLNKRYNYFPEGAYG